MTVADWYRYFTWLTLVAQAVLLVVVVVAIASRVSRDWRHRHDTIRSMLADQGLALAAIVASVATAGSLYLSEGGHLVPCRLCWFQRIAMYPLSVLLTIAAIRRDWSIRPYAITLAGVGLLISTWHYVIEWFPNLEGVGGRCDPSNPCSALPFARRFGYVSIPLMAGTAFICILVALLARSSPRRYP